MKKTLLALSVFAAATSAQAFELYNQDGVTVNMGGDIEVVYMNALTDDKETTTKDETDFKQDIQDADVKFDVRYAMTDSVQFGAFFEIQDTGTNTGDTYVALYTETMGSLKIGKLCTSLDDAGIGADYQYGITTFFKGASNGNFCLPEAVRYDIDTGSFYATVAMAQDKAGENKAIGKNSVFLDTRIGYRVADFDFTVLGGTTETETKDTETLLGAEVRYAGVENLNLAAAYYSMDLDKETSNTVALAAEYQLDVVALAAGYSFSSSDDKIVEDLNTWYVNAGYPLAPNTTAYVEVGGNDVKDSETGLAIGVKAEF